MRRWTGRGRRRVRQALQMPSDRRISDEVIDELLAGRPDRGGDRRAGRGAGAVDQAAGGAGDGGRADRPSRLRAAPGAARRGRQHPQRVDAEDADRPSTGRCGSRRRGIATGSFEPQIVRKRQRRFEGFDDKILALYARGLSTRDIEAHLAEIYGVKVGRDLISRVTDAVMDDVRAWQQRPLDDVYPVVFLDALVLKIREGGTVQRRACYLALGVTIDGDRDVLGMWFQETEGAKFWMQVLTELKQRGVRDILICCVDGLKGFPEAIEAIFPQTTVQTCIVHLIRHSLQVRAAPRARAGRPRPEADLHRRRRRRRPGRARGVRREVGRAVPGDHAGAG